MKKPVVLMILDGLGEAAATHGNAVTSANHPNLTNLRAKYPNIEIEASGEAVGLPVGQMGNSEVGHLNIGAGRIVYQSLVTINKAIEDGSFFRNENLTIAMENAMMSHSLHIMGLLSDGGVHSHEKHVYATIEMAHKLGVKNIYVHAILDGRDVDPKSALTYLERLDEVCKKNGAKIATISGRYYAMDRDKRWERVKVGYDVIANAEGVEFTDYRDYIEKSYAEGIHDEFVVPAVNCEVKKRIEDHDSVIFCNFRPDRAGQLAASITNKDYHFFHKERLLDGVVFVSMMQYSEHVKGLIAFEKDRLKNVFGEVIAKNDLKQLRIAETEKYPHVTFFFDGGRELGLAGKDEILIPSPQVATYDLMPEMSAYGICEKVVEKILAKEYDTIVINFANPDMVGHSGMLEPTVKAIEVVDEVVQKVVDATLSVGGVALITADHGNAERVLNEDGSPNTAHTTNLVNFLITDEGIKLKSKGMLSNIVPTMLELLGVEKPVEMTSESLIEK